MRSFISLRVKLNFIEQVAITKPSWNSKLKISHKKETISIIVCLYIFMYKITKAEERNLLCNSEKKNCIDIIGKEVNMKKSESYGRAIFFMIDDSVDSYWSQRTAQLKFLSWLQSWSFFECKCKEHLSHCFQHLEKVMIHRQQQYSEFRKLIAMRAKYFFIVLLSNRNYTGKMSFNHSKETLEMNVSLVWILFQALIHQCSLTPKCWAYHFLSFGCLIFTNLINILPSLVLFVEVGGYIQYNIFISIRMGPRGAWQEH